MENVIDTVQRLSAVVGISQISLDQAKTRGLVGVQTRPDGIEVGPVSRREIVETGDCLLKAQEGLDEVGTDKTGSTGHKPVARLGGQ